MKSAMLTVVAALVFVALMLAGSSSDDRETENETGPAGCVVVESLNASTLESALAAATL